MGRVGVAYGIRGWLRIQTFSTELDSLAQYPRWWLGKQAPYQAYDVLDWQIQAGGLVACLAGLTDRSSAERLRGDEIVIARAQLPHLAEDEYYWSDLIGLEVVNQAQQMLGHVVNLMETGANPVLVVRQEEIERLIPFVFPILQQVVMAEKKIRVDWGLDFG